MKDTRLNQALALLDDSRCLIVDVVDDRPGEATTRDVNQLDAARQFINHAIGYVQSAQSGEPHE